MANEVTLTFAGDDKTLGPTIRRTENDLERFQRQCRESADRLDQVGERFDVGETRAQGFRDGVTGVQDSMASASAFMRGDFAEGLLLAGSGLADTASTMANAVVPATRAMVARLGAARLAMLGLGAAAVAGVAALIYFATRSDDAGDTAGNAAVEIERVKKALDLASGSGNFRALPDLLGETRRELVLAADKVQLLGREFPYLTDNVHDMVMQGLRPLDEALAQAIDSGTSYEDVVRFLNMALGEERAQALLTSGALEQTAAAADFAAVKANLVAEAGESVAAQFGAAAASVQEFTSIIKAQTNPVLAFERAERAVESALKAYNETVKEHGKNSAEAADASLDLLSAQIDLQDAAARANQTTQATVEFLQDVAEQGDYTRQGVDEFTKALERAEAQAGKMNQMRIQLTVDFALTQGARFVLDTVSRLKDIFKFHSGTGPGGVPGPRGADVPVIAAAGEVILSPAESDAYRSGRLGGGGGSPVVLRPTVIAQFGAQTIEARSTRVNRDDYWRQWAGAR